MLFVGGGITLLSLLTPLLLSAVAASRERLHGPLSLRHSRVKIRAQVLKDAVVVRAARVVARPEQEVGVVQVLQNGVAFTA